MRNININQLSFFDNEVETINFCVASSCEYKANSRLNGIIGYYDHLNEDISHKKSNDDICTPMECVKTMIDYIPNELWKRKDIRILDPCCGNGNFGAYCMFKTDIDNIWFNEINPIRYSNCKKILNPKHINLGDAFALHGDFAGTWDLIMANPPYSGGGNKNRSLSNEFIEHSIDILNDNGYLCFITPNNWMTYNNDNTTLKKLLQKGSFIVIDNDAKKYFNGVGSSFTIIIWQKGVYNNKTKVVNNYLIKDIQEDVVIPNNLNFIPLYISQPILDIIEKCIQKQPNSFRYRCDLHNFTRKDLLKDEQDNIFKYETIHTPRKTRYACIKQDIYDKWIIIIPLSTYYIPYIKHNVNTTQSVGYFAFDTERQAQNYLKVINKDCFKLVIHLTRYGNFNNIMVLKHLNFDTNTLFNDKEQAEVNKLIQHVKY
jgi:adenine-specific DNA-methyltransferase